MVMDTVGCTPKFLKENLKAAKALADGYFAALDMIKADPKKSFEIMGADVKQSGEAFEKSQAYLRWQDKAANQKFFAGEHAQFSKEAADLLLEIGIIKQVPDLKALADTSFIKSRALKPLREVEPGAKIALGISFFVLFFAVGRRHAGRLRLEDLPGRP